MYFYEVFVSSGHYHGAEALTYSSVSSLDIGSLVSVPFGKSTVAGFVSREVSEPGFKTKPIGKQLHKKTTRISTA
jgi:primosomal protein N'